ncbi:uncharacterized mitochondrial protein-like protein [Tanacetum coccineum]|uniref:Uncharacterized mitochondrial protein-like protein n=1 Tax=Tanacetum coccineum TaxID=301880 RepID=A0ABQ5FEK9_9ASTR
MPALEDDSIFDFSRDNEDDGVMDDMNNLDTKIQVSPNPTTRIPKDHPLDQVIGDLQSATQTRKMSKNMEEHGKNPKRKIKKRCIMSTTDLKIQTFLDKETRFQRGKIDKILFIKFTKVIFAGSQFMWINIIFGSTKKELCNAFEKLMHEKFQMSSMGEVTFFLGLPVQQKKDGIFISRDKYVVEILKKKN